MKKVLIITYYWPPTAGSGVQRWLKFCKYFPNFDITPHIYTPENPSYNLQDKSLEKDIPKEAHIVKQKIWEPYGLYEKFAGKKNKVQNHGFTQQNENKSFTKKLATWIRGNVFIPDPRVYWVRPSVNFLKKYLKANDIQNIVSTGPPHSMHLIALKLKKQMPNLNWIADFRDPWTGFDVLEQFNLSTYALNKQKKQEAEVLKFADKVVMVTKKMQNDFQDFDQTKLYCITNGYDESDFANLNLTQTKDTFTIVHPGLLNELRNPSYFFAALLDLLENEFAKLTVELRLTGHISPNIKAQIAENEKLSAIVKLQDYLQHSEILKEYQLADLLLLFPNQGKSGKNQLPGKIFEYLKTRKPILAFCEPNSVSAEMIEKANAGFAVAFDKKEAIKKQLKIIFQNYISKNELKYNDDFIASKSRKSLTEQMSKLIE